MKLTRILPLLPIAIALASCGGSKSLPSESDSRYRRKPIVETTDERLAREAMLIDAKMMQETGRDSEAEQQYRKLLQTDPSCHAAQYELSRIMLDKGMIDSAIVYAKAAAEGDNGNVWYLLNQANLYHVSNQLEQCVRVWETIVQRNPDVLEYYYELSNAYLKTNNTKGAIDALNRVEKKVGVTETVSLQKAKLWTHAGNEAKAVQEIEALVKTMPQESRYRSILAETYMAAGKYDKAKEHYDRILASNPDDEYIHISLAEYYKAAKKPREAYEELRIAMGQHNLSTANKIHIVTNFYTTEEFYGIYSQYAFDLVETALRGSDDSISYAALYGDILMRQKKYEEATKQFTLYLTRDSSKYYIWEALLVAELSTYKDTARLASDARRAAALFPLHPLPYYMQAVVEHDNGRYEHAIELAKRCEQLGFDKGYLEPDTYMMLADCYNRLNDTACYAYYERLLRIYPNDLQALNSYAYRLALDGNHLDKAEQMSKQTLKAEPDNHYFLDTYAWILHRMGRDREAITYIEKAMKRGEPSDEVNEHWKSIKSSLEKTVKP